MAQKGRRALLVGGPVALLLAFMTWGAVWWGGQWASGPSALVSTGIPAPGVTLYPIESRPTTPNVDGETLTGGHLDLAEMNGHVQVINVWGSWCVPCRAEAPELVRAAKESQSDGVRFIGIDTRDTKAAAQAFVRRFGITYPSLFDPGGAIVLRYSDLIPISAIPSTLIIDREGRVAARVVGKVDYTTLRGLIDDALASHADPQTLDSARS